MSSTGNSILRQKDFISYSSGSSITKNCCIGTTKRDGKTVKVVDTPGFFGNSLTLDEIRHEVLNCFYLTKPGPHAILYILRIGRFTNEELQGVRSFLEIFGGNPLKHTVIVLTGVDDLKWNESSTEEYLNNAHTTFKTLINECNGRCVFLNNRLSNSKDADNQLDELFIVVEKMLKENNLSKDPYYTNHIFTQIGEDMRICVENKPIEATCTSPYIRGGSTLLVTGLVCAVTGVSLWLPVVAGVVTMTMSFRQNNLKKSDDKLSKVLEEIKEDRIIQCIIS